MCLGIPMRIIEIRDNKAICEQSGTSIEAYIDMLDDVKVGDFVLIHAGFAIKKISEDDASETIKLLNEIFSKDER
ncbi:MAG: HypC/HybG/HupF family hydrogenase formation chaperone [Deltaproteobacteria bacterium]|nr:HypC/HybG/HupF family hydrogenase formation chaperone [Deltaproteobacteria bacterium]